MRFDEFLECNAISFSVVNELDGYLVEVAVPTEWVAVQSSLVPSAWVWRDDPCKELFCANAVLTMARAESLIDPDEVFTMLCEWQVQMMPGVHEMRREPAVEHSGPGIMGTLDLIINTDIGILQCVEMARVIAADSHTLIAQLTFTSLLESPVHRSQIGFGVFPSSWASPTQPSFPGAPAPGPTEVH